MMTSKFQKLEGSYQSLFSEYNILKCKLESKTEAVLILSRELDQYRSERDQYKLMADQLRERYSALKKRVEGWGPSLLGVYDVRSLKGEREQSLVQLLCELKEQNKSLQFEVDDYKQKLNDSQGDIKLLREQMARHRVGSTDEGVNTRFFQAFEREDLVKQLEAVRHKCSMLEKDLQAVLDEKEELVTARDSFKHKIDRLNHQLNCVLRGGVGTEVNIVDIDGVLMENRYLQERIKQVQEEKAMVSATLSKYKNMLEKKRTRSGVKLGGAAGGLLFNKQVQQLLQTTPFLDLSEGPVDLRTLVVALFESLNDKMLALCHQKKANKILGNRITELEKKIKTIEVTTPWHLAEQGRISAEAQTYDSEMINRDSETPCPDNSSSSNLNQPCEYTSSSISLDIPPDEVEDNVTDSRRNSEFTDLDLLPTKEYVLEDKSAMKNLDMSSHASTYNDSCGSTRNSSPLHQRTALHSDSELTPWKSVVRTNSADAILRTRSYSVQSEQDDDDDESLPPNLEKLLAAALAEIEKSTEQSKMENSPAKLSPVKDDDPSC